MSETEINEGISKIIDSEKTSITTDVGPLTLRDILTAVFNAQQEDTRWISRLTGKRGVQPEVIVIYLPKRVGEYVTLTKNGQYLDFFNRIVDGLDLLTILELLKHEEKDNTEFFGLTSLGKAFVNYGEPKKEKS